MTDKLNKNTDHVNNDIYTNEDGISREELMSRTTILETLTDAPEERLVQQEPVQEEEPEKKKETSAMREVIEFFRDLAVCMITVLLLTNFIARPVQVHGSSMFPTLHDTSLGFSNILGYRTSGIKRFDIVIIYIEEKDEYLVKRCVGLPGETVSYVNGQLMIDGEYVPEEFFDEEYVAECIRNGETFMNEIQPITLGEDEYYCLGDNRPHSTDSRYYGPFSKEQIKSKGVFVFWPLSRIGGTTW